MIEGIGRWVLTESPTRNAAAVNRMVDLVQSDVADLPVAVERIPGRDGLADSLVVRDVMTGEGPGILILSHIDTVHPIGTVSGPLPFRREGDRLYGPGLYDMKGGAYLALEAFRQVTRARSARLPITFVFTPDEEIGSPTSRSLIEAEARRARYVLVTEPACDGGKVVTARKGVGRFEVKTTGVPAHAGARHQDGRSLAILLAHLIVGQTAEKRDVRAAVATEAFEPAALRSVAGDRERHVREPAGIDCDVKTFVRDEGRDDQAAAAAADAVGLGSVEKRCIDGRVYHARFAIIVPLDPPRNML